MGRTPEALAKGWSVKKTSAASTTLYPSASVEIAVNAGQQSYTRFPHMDVVLKRGACPPLWLRAFGA